MSRLRYLALFAVTIVSIAAFAECRAVARDDRGLRDTEQEWISALTAHDANVLGCLLSEDFADSSWKGSFRPKEQVLRELDKRSPYAQRVEVEKTLVLHDMGVVFGRNIISDASGKTVMEIRFTDTFIYKNHKWLAVAAQETPVRR